VSFFGISLADLLFILFASCILFSFLCIVNNYLDIKLLKEDQKYAEQHFKYLEKRMDNDKNFDTLTEMFDSGYTCAVNLFIHDHEMIFKDCVFINDEKVMDSLKKAILSWKIRYSQTHYMPGGAK